jgi:succinate-semialdehyde dehydrogenase/glutarate-semialdehyde dehydrogenase
MSQTAAPNRATLMNVDVPTDLLIGGEWTPSGRTLEVHDPSTGALLTAVADATVADAQAAVSAAYAAFGPWASTSPRRRAEVLRAAYEIMAAQQEDCARLIVLENGKAWADAMSEVAYAAEFFRWFSEEACRIPGDFRTSPAGDKTIIVDHQPVGVAYMITPWNFPAAMATRKLAPALAAGCTAVLKPAAETPLTALWIADVLRRAGAPDGVVNVITTSDPGPVSDAVLIDPRVGTLSFTGSTGVGKMLLARTAQRSLPASMELGGNAPLLVLEGADLNNAVAGALAAKMRNGGSACTAANRFYVHESLVAPFSDAFEHALRGIAVGSGLDPTNGLGAMVSTSERDKVLELVARAVDEGATASEASTPPAQGAFIGPHVVRGVEHGQTLTREEIFGPVAPIVTVDSTEQAVHMANDTQYGLISYVFAKDQGEGIRVARQLQSGMVAVNRGVASDPAAPFGGMKESGLGREGGFAGIHEYLQSQYIAADL